MSWGAAVPLAGYQYWRTSLVHSLAYGPLRNGRALHLHLACHHDAARRSQGSDTYGNDKGPSPEPTASRGHSVTREASGKDATTPESFTLPGNPPHIGATQASGEDATTPESSSLPGNPPHIGATGMSSGSAPAVAAEPHKSPTLHWGFSPIPFVARGRSMPGQRLLPCTSEDAAILAKAQSKYPSPQQVEGGIIVRIIAAKHVHKVTSPVLRVVRNRQYGIRKSERLRLALGGAFFSAVLGALGVWQLRRMEEKKRLIEYRRSHLVRQPTVIVSSPFPWTLDAAANSERRKLKAVAADSTGGTTETRPGATVSGSELDAFSPGQGTLSQESKTGQLVDSDADLKNCPADDHGQPRGHVPHPLEMRRQRSGRLLAAASPADVKSAVASWAYNPVVVHGVLDSTTELFVGPRPGLEVGNPGYCVVSPLRLHDGSVILVNKGHLPMKLAKLPPFPKAVDEEDELIAFMQHRQRQQLVSQQSLEAQQRNLQVDHLQQQQPRLHYVDAGSQQRLEQLQELAGSRTEPIGSVTVRGVLEPGEVCNSSFKSLMLKNKPQDGQFLVLNPADLAEATPGIQNRTEAGLLMVNAYSIVYDEDLQSASAGVNGSASRVANRFMSYQQKQKADYLLFYADEHTHFNYACQWFLMGLFTAAMTIYKLVEVSRWRW